MKKATRKYLTAMSIIFTGMIILAAIQVVLSPLLLVRLINTILIIFVSACTGAFIREMFILKQK
ncbi:hypothetical protein KDN24_10705 [Bacillus sp. Bva_UNVM-123]|uniref:hypothetical protein n=1 Tax=Bacillus sp. Bva_UNVM-123 TaxID=2829798 RepID=UPI00391FC7BC